MQSVAFPVMPVPKSVRDSLIWRRHPPCASASVHRNISPRPMTSAPSSLDFGVESFQFHAGVFDTKLPIDAALFAVRLVRPGRNFSLQYGQFTDAAVAETLAR